MIDKHIFNSRLLSITRSIQKLITLVGLAITPICSGQIVISEWLYSGTDGEFVEFTNVGESPIDMTGWSFDDASQTPKTVDLSGFGIITPGESVILTQATAADFSLAWDLTETTVIGEQIASLGRNDQINLYDADNNLVDQLSYGDEDFPGTPRSQNISCNIPSYDYDKTISQMYWTLASIGDGFGSRLSAGGDIASPGRTVGYSKSDFNTDGYVNIDDFSVFAHCFCCPAESYESIALQHNLTMNLNGFIATDFDEDRDIDLHDFAAFAKCYSGNDLADPFCGSNNTTQINTATIKFNDNYITTDGTGLLIDGTTVTIYSPGKYTFNGTLNNGQIIINSEEQGLVEIILNGVNISNSTSAPIYIMEASFTAIVLAENSQNYLSDAATYIYTDPTIDEPSGCLFSKDSMAIYGSGSLYVSGNYNDAIVCKDKLAIYSGIIDINSVDDGIRSKDCLLVYNGEITLNTLGDALKSDNDEDPNYGYITIRNGSLDITSGGDGISAVTNVNIIDGCITARCGGGYTATISDDLSAKGIKGLTGISIHGGTLDLDCADDALHSNNTISVNGGISTLSTSDDAIHADSNIVIDGGSISVINCYEGLESTEITINSGVVNIISDEDAITADTSVVISGGEFNIRSGGGYTATIAADASAKGIKGLVGVMIEGGSFIMNCADDALHSNDTITINNGTFTIATKDDGIHADANIVINGGNINITNSYEGIEAAIVTINNGEIHVNASDDGINVAGGTDGSGGPWMPPGIPGGGSNSNYFLYINGGYIVVNSIGDGLDANGSIYITGGTTIVNGPTANNNNAVDYDGKCEISGGTLVAVGSSQMAQALSSTSTQCSVKINYSAVQAAGTMIHLESSSGANILSFKPSKNYQSCVFSSPDFKTGTTYKQYVGGNCSGTASDGLYLNGTYTAGTLKNTFTINSILTSFTSR